MTKIETCLFDLDGVIVDTAVYHYKAWKRLANDLGFDFTEQQNEKLKGISRARSLELILEWGGVEKTELERAELATRKNQWYVDMINNMQPDEILPGTEDFLKALKAGGYKIGLGSASKNSGAILQKVGLKSYFDAVVDGNVVTTSKPDPEVFLKGAELLGVDPAACVVFEDAIAGVAAAKAGGMKVVGIGEPAVLTGADLVVSGLDQMDIHKLKALES